MKMWIEQHKINIANITYNRYKQQIEGRIKEFFNSDRYILKEVTGDDSNDFYSGIISNNCKGSTALKLACV